MRDFFQEFILNQFVVSVALMIVLGFLTRWALIVKKEYIGYGLGWLVSLLLLITYTIMFGDRPRFDPFADLNIFQIFLSIFLGLATGAAIQYSKDMGKDIQGHYSKRSVALRVAAYTMLNLILLGLVIVESSVVQRMIGIFGLAFGIAILLGMVWELVDDEQPKQGFPPQQGNIPPQSSSQAANRYDTRRNIKNRDRR